MRNKLLDFALPTQYPWIERLDLTSPVCLFVCCVLFVLLFCVVCLCLCVYLCVAVGIRECAR